MNLSDEDGNRWEQKTWLSITDGEHRKDDILFHELKNIQNRKFLAVRNKFNLIN